MKTWNANNALVVVVVIQLSGTEKYNIELFKEGERDREREGEGEGEGERERE